MFRPRPTLPPLLEDLSDVMVGRCQSCKAVVECLRSAATPPATAAQLARLSVTRGTGGFNTPEECWSVECPACKAKTATVTDTDGNVTQGSAGPRVYLTRKAK
ncbi:MAG: hypothetical protein KGL39_32625 [Patescibacteria group bacterium]|nr:hypothetical protein [Patescibacteria group bacterium]